MGIKNTSESVTADGIFTTSEKLVEERGHQSLVGASIESRFLEVQATDGVVILLKEPVARHTLLTGGKRSLLALIGATLYGNVLELRALHVFFRQSGTHLARFVGMLALAIAVAHEEQVTGVAMGEALADACGYKEAVL